MVDIDSGAITIFNIQCSTFDGAKRRGLEFGFWIGSLERGAPCMEGARCKVPIVRSKGGRTSRGEERKDERRDGGKEDGRTDWAGGQGSKEKTCAKGNTRVNSTRGRRDGGQGSRMGGARERGRGREVARRVTRDPESPGAQAQVQAWAGRGGRRQRLFVHLPLNLNLKLHGERVRKSRISVHRGNHSSQPFSTFHPDSSLRGCEVRQPELSQKQLVRPSTAGL